MYVCVFVVVGYLCSFPMLSHLNIIFNMIGNHREIISTGCPAIIIIIWRIIYINSYHSEIIVDVAHKTRAVVDIYISLKYDAHHKNMCTYTARKHEGEKKIPIRFGDNYNRFTRYTHVPYPYVMFTTVLYIPVIYYRYHVTPRYATRKDIYNK